MITIYSPPTPCVQCTATKREFVAKGIPFEAITLTPEQADAFKAEGHQQAPVVVTPRGTWAGFRPDLIRGLLSP